MDRLSPTEVFVAEPAVRSWRDHQADIASTLPDVLERRLRECREGGHVWRPLADNPFGTTSRAEFCGWCLRVRVGGYEGWGPP
jgi:hypothetical protein